MPSKRPFLLRWIHKLEDLIDDFILSRFILKVLSYSYLALILWLTYAVLPFPGHWSTSRTPDNIPVAHQDLSKYVPAYTLDQNLQN